MAFRITVIGENTRARDDQYRILRGRVEIVRRHRRLIHRIDGDRNRGQVAVQVIVRGPVLEAVRACEARIRRIGETTREQRRQGPVRRINNSRDAQGMSFRVNIVGQHAR